MSEQEKQGFTLREALDGVVLMRGDIHFTIYEYEVVELIEALATYLERRTEWSQQGLLPRKEPPQ
jgi:hypothetical protein